MTEQKFYLKTANFLYKNTCIKILQTLWRIHRHSKSWFDNIKEYSYIQIHKGKKICTEYNYALRIPGYFCLPQTTLKSNVHFYAFVYETNYIPFN